MSEWKEHVISDLCSAIIDCVNKTAPISPTPTPYQMLRTSDVRGGFINLEGLNCVTEEVFAKWTRRGLLEEGDVIFTREAPLGEAAIVRDAKNYFLGQRLILYRANPKVCDNRFLLYWFLNPINKEGLKTRGVGSTVAHMRVPECERIKVTAPSLKTQQRIADILSAYDALIETNQRQIKLLEEAAQLLYKEWFVDLRYPGHEDAPVVDGVPEGWKKKTIDNLCVKTKNTVLPDNIPAGTPYIGLEHIPRHDFCLSDWGDASEVSSTKALFKRNDIIFGQIRPYFHKVGFAITDGVASTDSFIMTPIKDVWGLFLMTVFSDAYVNYAYQTCKEGAKMPRADWNQMRQYPVLIADSQTQRAFEERIHCITEEVRNLALQHRYLSEARDRLLPKLMSGEITV